MRTFCALLTGWCLAGLAHAEIPPDRLAQAAGNRAEIEAALARVPPSQREGLEFLVRHMPLRDLKSLSADFLLENTRLAYLSRAEDVWAADVPKEVFHDAVLPYAVVNEDRDAWRADFRKRFLPLAQGAKRPKEVATRLNQAIFRELGVKYSTKRRRADQSPAQSIESGLASCTGLSILLIDACRALGVPARFVGTPLWSNRSGNHSWVEIWDEGWHFTGAAEPTGDDLNKGWFVARAAQADRASRLHAIYATSFRRTPLSFPCVWARHVDYISAVNVTDRYVRLKQDTPEGMVHAMFVVKRPDGHRCQARLKVVRDGEVVFEGQTNDEGFDANDHRRVLLAKDADHVVKVEIGGVTQEQTIRPSADDQLVVFTAANPNPKASKTIEALRQYLATDRSTRADLAGEAFARAPLSAVEVEAARQLLAADFHADVRKTHAEAWKAQTLVHKDLKMPFFMKKFGKQPSSGWSVVISMHGGGGAPPVVNDRQWENQKRLYTLKEGIYVAPRAPSNTWDLWHQAHIDPLFLTLVQCLVAFEGADANRVYITGYSAGGDGVYQLAPRMADHWGAAAMMAGHPNETSPLGLRNLPFALQMGGRDAAYKRNETARSWEQSLGALQQQDPGGYEHFVKIYPNKGHWMDREDAVALPWMAKFQRQATPERVVWKQDNVTHPQFYWLSVDKENEIARSEVTAKVQRQKISIGGDGKVSTVTVHLDDRFIDLEKPVRITSAGREVFVGRVERTIGALAGSLALSGDPALAFPARVRVNLAKPNIVSP